MGFLDTFAQAVSNLVHRPTEEDRRKEEEQKRIQEELSKALLKQEQEKRAQEQPRSQNVFPEEDFSTKQDSGSAQVSQQTRDYQAMQPKVGITDVLREVPAATGQVADKILDLTVRGIATRPAAQGILSLSDALQLKPIAGPNQDTVINELPITNIGERILYGKEPVKSYQKQTRDIAQTERDIGIPEQFVGPSSLVLGTINAGLDLPGANLLKAGGKELAEQGAKTVVKEGGEQLVKNLVKEEGEQVIKDLTKEEVQQGLQTAAKEGEQALETGIKAPIVRAYDIPKGEQERKFIETVREAGITAPEVAQGVEGTYKPITNKATLEQATQRVTQDVNAALEFATQPGNDGAEKTATQLVLMKKFQDEGNFTQAIDIAEKAAEQATTKGQAIQALSMWGRLTPEGILSYAQRVVNKVNSSLPDTAKKLKLTEDQTKKFISGAEELQKLPEGSRDRIVKTAELMRDISEMVPRTLGEKISGLQTLAQLLNPKTTVRNIMGNLGFAGIENVKDVVATPLDIAVGAITGNRTKTLPMVKEEVQSGMKGFVEGVQDALKGIDTGATKTQFELPKGRIFKNKFLRGAETALDVTLKAPDRAFYTAAYEDSLRQQMKLARIAEPTDAMKEVAHYDGLYRTFQDDNVVSRVFSGVKKALNTIGMKDKSFGLGDLIIKYPKTPGAILDRAINYSPLGFIQSTLELAKPLFGKTFDQKQFVEATSRSLVGTAGLVGTGALLHKLGIISGEPTKDKDINAIQRERGLGDYRLNVSALKRLVTSGFNAEKAAPKTGDTIISYDWFQPQSIGLAIGADVDANKGTNAGVVGTIVEALTSASNTLIEQPLVTGLSNLFKYGDLPQGIKETLTAAPASFIPTMLNQIRQLTDNTSRNVEDPDLLKKSGNMVLNKLPIVSQQLPPRVNTRGQDQELYQNGTNTLFNVFINPSFVSTLKEDPVGKEVMSMFERSGETQQAPRVVGRSVEIVNKSGKQETLKLNGKQIADMQRYVGTVTDQMFKKVVENPKFVDLPDEKKAQMMANLMSDAMTAAKIAILGHAPQRVDQTVIEILNAQKKNIDQGNLPLITR